MNRLALVAELLKHVYLYAAAHDNRVALEQLSEIRRCVTRCEMFHRTPTIIDNLSNDDDGL